MPGMVTYSAGRIVLLVPGFVEFMCVQAQISMNINAVPMANVTVAGGVSVRMPGMAAVPEELLVALNSEDAALFPCELREVSASGAQLVVFRGYLVNGGAHYASSGALFTFTCMGLAAGLMATPGGQYVEAPLNAVLDTVMYDSKDIGIEAALRKSNNYLQDQQQSLDDLYEISEHLPLVQRIALLVRAVRASISTQELIEVLKLAMKDPEKAMDKDVLRVLGGKTRLREDTLPTSCARQLSESFMSAAMGALSGGSIWDAVFGCLTSQEFALELVPRWTCDEPNDFRMELAPVSAWRPRGIIYLSAADIASLDAHRDSLTAVNTPDIIVVRLADPRALELNETAGQVSDNTMYAGVRGVAAKSPALNRQLRAHLAGTSFMSDVSRMGRVRQMDMPRWCAVMPQKNDEDAAKQQELANRIAETALQYYYRNSDYVSISLPAAFRFGLSGVRYEDHLGDRVVVSLGDNASALNRGLRLYGCLNGIVYTYENHGGGSTATYVWNLSRVMYMNPATGGADAWEAGTLDMDNPIYETT